MAAQATQVQSGAVTLVACLMLAACTDRPTAAPPSPKPPAAQRLVGVPTVVDADTLVINGRAVKLWGIDAPARDARCADANGVAWPCGEHAAAALTHRLDGRSVNCDPRGAVEANPVVALCRLNGNDVGKWLVMHGWALDAAQSRGAYGPLGRAAAGERRGIHGGPPVAPATEAQ
ncbi:thermonuclease family protein [Cognatilysobacter bugurensis]|uniref:TNase-like domain-containing protein n=1 Tax=Cognatilysobacter bugurensis TaxID=543356 RepID=A0A918W8D2_9GAMM|nr:thermonuclease family protein [Lysobacter bugurensis]GHA80405.1 hypothetical protein GCM10007067_17710 [Lysobacter bugurensis]